MLRNGYNILHKKNRWKFPKITKGKTKYKGELYEKHTNPQLIRNNKSLTKLD